MVGVSVVVADRGYGPDGERGCGPGDFAGPAPFLHPADRSDRLRSQHPEPHPEESTTVRTKPRYIHHSGAYVPRRASLAALTAAAITGIPAAWLAWSTWTDLTINFAVAAAGCALPLTLLAILDYVAHVNYRAGLYATRHLDQYIVDQADQHLSRIYDHQNRV